MSTRVAGGGGGGSCPGQDCCLPFCTWSQADAPDPPGLPSWLHRASSGGWLSLPFFGSCSLVVTPLPFCTLWFCKSRNLGTETSLQGGGRPGNNGLAPALQPRPQTTFPAPEKEELGVQPELGWAGGVPGRSSLQGHSGFSALQCPALPTPPILIWKSATFFQDSRMDNLASRALSPAVCP